MNRSLIQFHLEEALEELVETLDAIKNERIYSDSDFRTGMEHLYHHLNFAWNTRNLSSQYVNDHTDETFYELRKFPLDIDLRDPSED